MEGNTNRNPNEQGGDSATKNANDWRSQHDPQYRKRVLSKIIEKLKGYFPARDEGSISHIASEFEEKTYNIAKDKNDYIRKLSEKMHWIDKTYKNVKSGSSINRTNTPPPAQVVTNQAKSLPTSLPYTQTPTRQQQLPQNTQNNVNMPVSSGLPSQVPITVSVAQNVNAHVGEGVHRNTFPGSQRQMQERQQPQHHQMNQQLLKEQISHGNLRPSHMQQQAQPPQQQHHPQSLLNHPIQQSFPQSSALSSLPSSSHQTSILQNSQLLPRHQFPTQWVRSSHQQQMVLPSHEQKQQEQEKHFTQMMNVPNTQQNHPTSRQNIGEQQGAFRGSSSHQNNIASFQAMGQHMPPQRLNNASALPSQQQQNMLSGQSGNFNAPGSSLLGTQSQEVGQSQPMVSQQYGPQYPMQQQPQNKSSQQHLDTQRFQEASSLRQTQNIANQHNQPHQLQSAPLANPSSSQDSTGKTVNATVGDWQEETYQKIKALKEMHLPVLSTMLHRIMGKLMQIESLPPQKKLSETIEKLNTFKSSVEHVMGFINVHRNNISEKHRDRFKLFEDTILKLTKNQTTLRKPMQQQQQGQFAPPQTHQTALQSHSPQVHVSQPLEKDQMNSRLMSSNQNGASSSVSVLRSTSQTSTPHLLKTMPNLEPRDENNNMASSRNILLPSHASNPQAVHSNICSVQSSMFQPQQQKQFHHRQIQQPLLHRQQQQQKQQKVNHQLQIPTSHQTNEMNDVRMRQAVNNKAGLLQQRLSLSQHQLQKQLSNVSPPASSPQIQHHSSPKLVDQQILPAKVNKTLAEFLSEINKTGTPQKSGGSPFVAPSPIPGDPERPISVESPASGKLGTQESTLCTLPPDPITERPIDRLIKAFESAAPKSLAEFVSEISSVISTVDRIAGSFHPGGGSRAGLGEDLSERTKYRFQTRNLMTQGETYPTKRLKRSINTQPRDMTSQSDSYKQFSGLEYEVDSTASSGSKVNKIEPGCDLLQEIREINGRLVETVVEICDEDTSGTIVTCSYVPLALSATFKDHYNSGRISQIQPLRLRVPVNYPYSSPISLEEASFDTSVHKYEDLSAKTISRFSLSMKQLSEPMSLKEISQTWNDCARATMVEYAEQHGGGTFSSKYGGWETVLRAS